MTLVTKTGGLAGFFASERESGWVHPPGINVSADDTTLGGAGGNTRSLGGGTNPASFDPSAPRTVPTHIVASTIDVNFIIAPLVTNIMYGVR